MTVPVAGASRRLDPLAQATQLARRSIVGMARQPTIWMPGLAFPLMLAAVNAAAMGKSIHLPAFQSAYPGVESFVQFLLPATLLQGVMLGGVVGGADVALDIEDGFFERLVASPVARSSILVGRLAGAAVLGAVQAVLFVAAFAAFGARVAGGIPAVLVLVLLGMISALAIGGLTSALGLRTGSQEVVQNSFPLIFVLLFVSSAYFPTSLMKGWYKAVATHNPVSWLIDAARELVIVGWSWKAAATTLGIAAIGAVLGVLIAIWQFRRRLAASS